jgi:hypothetical protein
MGLQTVSLYSHPIDPKDACGKDNGRRLPHGDFKQAVSLTTFILPLKLLLTGSSTPIQYAPPFSWALFLGGALSNCWFCHLHIFVFLVLSFECAGSNNQGTVTFKFSQILSSSWGKPTCIWFISLLRHCVPHY